MVDTAVAQRRRKELVQIIYLIMINRPDAFITQRVGCTTQRVRYWRKRLDNSPSKQREGDCSDHGSHPGCATCLVDVEKPCPLGEERQRGA